MNAEFKKQYSISELSDNFKQHHRGQIGVP